jgi:hypothetical protein
MSLLRLGAAVAIFSFQVAALAAPPPSGGPPLANDALRQPPRAGAGGLMIPFGGGEYDQTEFLHGRVGVIIIIPESNGTIDANEFSWTAGQRANVIAEIRDGMEWWKTAIAGDTGKLEFTFFIHDSDVSIGYEPIRRDMSEDPDQSLVTGAILTALGQSTAPDPFTAMKNYNESVRRANPQLDWVYTIIVCHDGENAANRFATSGRFAFAYLGGPFMVMTYTNAGWGIANMDLVCAHEMGHIFYALDEYLDAGVVGSETSGYIPAQNGNTLAGGGIINEPSCIMRSASSPLSAQTGCFYTRGQVGLQDSDGDRVPDILDLAPLVQLTTTPAATIDSSGFVITGHVLAESFPNLNPNTIGSRRAMTINQVDSAEFRIDSSAWQRATAVDGNFDTPLERFTAHVTGYLGDTHTLEIRGAIRVGHDSTRVVFTPIRSYAFFSTFSETSIRPFFPADSTCTNLASPTFRWARWNRPNVAAYRLEFADSTSFTNVAATCTAAGNETSAEYPLPMGRWYWRVVGVDTIGLSETSAAIRIEIDTSPPAKPVIAAPRPDSFFVKREPRVTGANALDSGCGVAAMRVGYSASPAFASETIVILSTLDTLVLLPDSGLWYFRVAYRDSATNDGAWSDSVRIQIGASGDFNGTGSFDADDAFAFARYYGGAASTLPLADLNEDGALNFEDVVILIRNLFR